MSGEILAALLGAHAAGGLQTVVSIGNRKRERESVLTAIASEVHAIRRLIRHQNYLGHSNDSCERIQNQRSAGDTFVIGSRANYFSAHEGLVSKLGNLNPKAAVKIVNFYVYCKSAIDSIRPDGSHAFDTWSPDSADNTLSLNQILRAVFLLGDEIVQLPRMPIVELPVRVDS
ncbi:MAG: hypothetical protein H7267_12525 [Sandarakinorhabdus sp.]|nr:hypothetical protein [Sandarakinorhabdus sp.]